MGNNILFFLSEAFRSFRRSGLMTFIAIATITISLIVFGMFLLLSANLNRIADAMSAKLEIRLYLKDEMDETQIPKLVQNIQNLSTVKSVEFVNRDEAWKTFKSYYSAMELSDYVSRNPLPNSLQVIVHKNENIDAVARYIKNTYADVEDVSYMGELAHRIRMASTYFRIVGVMLVALLTFATLLITINTIRLTVLARQAEIEIMQLVGATNAFIRWPFIFEGLLMGIVGATVAVSFLKFGYYFIRVKVQQSLPFMPMVFDTVTLNIIFGVVGSMGIVLGIMGAVISVNRTLKLM